MSEVVNGRLDVASATRARVQSLLEEHNYVPVVRRRVEDLLVDVGGPEDHLCSRARIDGYRTALERAGLRVDPSLVRHGTFRHEGGYDRARELLALADPPTAIFGGSDEQDFRVLEAARVSGLSVPDDLSVVGFDDLPMARWSSPPLTTVRQPLAEMGRMAGRMLHRLIHGEALDTNRVELATHLVLRASTGATRS